MKTNRQLHLWIGLLTSILVLVESVTGLLLAEPWLMGANVPARQQGMPFERAQMDTVTENQDNQNLNSEQQKSASQRGQNFNGELRGRGAFRGAGTDNGLIGIVKGLHSGRVGSTDLKIIVDLSAVALIVLTVTGIILSVKTLKAQSKQNQESIEQN